MAVYDIVPMGPNGVPIDVAMLACDAIINSGSFTPSYCGDLNQRPEFDTFLGKHPVHVEISPRTGRISIDTDLEVLERARNMAEEVLSYNFVRLETLPAFLTFGGGRLQNSHGLRGIPE